jgi:S1-C subfamily serine protease
VSIGFATPASTVNVIVPQLLEHGKAVHAYFGAALSELTTDVAPQAHAGAGPGLFVDAVATGGPAAKAGIEVGDVLTAMDATRLPTVLRFVTALRSHRPGDVVTMTMLRRTKVLTTKVTLMQQPS